MKLDDLRVIVAARSDPRDYPHAAGEEQEVLVYDVDGIRAAPRRSWCTRSPTGRAWSWSAGRSTRPWGSANQKVLGGLDR